MELLSHTSVLFLAFIGWAAGCIAIYEARLLTRLQQRLLLVFTWALWIIPAFDVLIYRGLIAVDMAFALGGVLTLMLVLSVSLSALSWRTRS